ncbi:salicylate hydroxylase [Marasmius fiardii PR-910]|nr:salicylate hydroxylase [Marasmius fiardii PR-910]
MSKDFTVAIVGGGLCGLAAAYPLQKAGISVKVFEAAAKFEEIGAAVAFGPNAIRALEDLGLLPAILVRSGQDEPVQPLFRFVEGYAPHNVVFDYEKTNSTTLGFGVYRPACLDGLISLLDPSITQFNKRCTSVSTTESGRTRIHFLDGTTHDADLVIGADGIRSATRKFVVGEDTRSLVFANTVAYRGLIPLEDLVKAGIQTDLSIRPTNFVGTGRHIICLPILGNKVINVVAFAAQHDLPKGPELPVPWVEAVTHEELKANFADWGPDGQIIVDHLKNPSKWSIHACIPPLQNFVRGRVALVGDAAHAMLPHLGSGLGQGFEDVYILTRLLTHPSTKKSNLDGILAHYNEIRPPRANDVLERSTRAAEVYDNYGPGRYDATELEARLRGQWEPVWDYDVREVIQTSFQKLRAEGVFPYMEEYARL